MDHSSGLNVVIKLEFQRAEGLPVTNLLPTKLLDYSSLRGLMYLEPYAWEDLLENTLVYNSAKEGGNCSISLDITKVETLKGGRATSNVKGLVNIKA